MATRRKLALAALLAIMVLVVLPPARAQTTSILNLSYPELVVGERQAQVSFTVAYSKAPLEGGYLLVGIWDDDGGDYAFGQVVSPEQDTCHNWLSYILRAACVLVVRSLNPSGSEHVKFRLVLAVPSPEYHFHAFSILSDKRLNEIPTSEDKIPFTIRLKLTLTVEVPAGVEITVDGQPTTGGVLPLDPGSHKVSVPNLVNINSTSRLRFAGWDDGIQGESRTVILPTPYSSSYNQVLKAKYIIQYYLTLDSSESNSTGAGWYDEGSAAPFRVESESDTFQMNGILGTLGGFWRFQGWYEGGQLIGNSRAGSIAMNTPRHLTARWQPDYTYPIIVVTTVAILAGLVVLTLTLADKRRKKHRPS